MNVKSQMRSRLRTARLLFLIPLMLLMSCAKPVQHVAIVETNSGCKVFRQISWEPKDTKPTVQQVMSHNRAYAKLCPKK